VHEDECGQKNAQLDKEGHIGHQVNHELSLQVSENIVELLTKPTTKSERFQAARAGTMGWKGLSRQVVWLVWPLVTPNPKVLIIL
jgi:hypothetical protein